MPKRKASAWPASILSDPDVLSLDEEGRFVLCKICHVHYAVHGGKKPRPVLMNSNFRTRAWDVHKLRTNSHRLQREHERARRLQQQHAQQQQQEQDRQEQEEQDRQEQDKREQERKQQLADAASSSAASSQVMTTTSSSRSGDVDAALGPRGTPAWATKQAKDTEQEDLEDKQRHVEQEQEYKQEGGRAHRRWAEMSMAALGPRESRPMHRLRAASSPFPEVSSVPAPRSGSTPSSPQASDDREHEDKAAAAAAVVATLRRPFQLPLAAPPEGPRTIEVAGRETSGELGSPQITTAQMYATRIEGMARWRHMHDDVSRALRTQPAKRRKPSSDRDRDPDGDSESRESEDSSELSSSSVTASSSGGNATAGSASSVGVSTGAKPVETYSRRELRAASALAGTEEMSGNREMVARKLKSLNDQYRARNLRPEDTAAFLDPSSASYQTFWGTFRDVYSSRTDSKTPAGATTREASMATARPTHHHHHHHHHHYSEGRRELASERRQEKHQPSSTHQGTAAAAATAAVDGEDLTTPGSSSNSSNGALLRPQEQENPHMWQVVHDQQLVRAFDRLTGAVSTQLSEMFVQEAASRREALSGLTQAVADLGTHQGHSIKRLVNLQERHLTTMEEMLQHKLWRETIEQRSEMESADEHEETKDQEMKEDGGGL